MRKERTFNVQLVHLELDALLAQQRLAGPAVRAVALAEHHDRIVVDHRLRLLLRGGHGGRAGRRRRRGKEAAREEAAEERNFGGSSSFSVGLEG